MPMLSAVKTSFEEKNELFCSLVVLFFHSGWDNDYYYSAHVVG